MSPLSRTGSRDEQTVHIDIFEDAEGGWLLQVVDDRGNLTGWTESFATERAALDEAVSAINDEGIASFVASLSGDFPWPAGNDLH